MAIRLFMGRIGPSFRYFIRWYSWFSIRKVISGNAISWLILEINYGIPFLKLEINYTVIYINTKDTGSNMDREYITRLIREYNLHLGGRELVVPGFRRELCREVERWMPKDQAIAIVGLRRTGKTTIMKQFISVLGESASYFSFDEEETQRKDVLVFVIDYMLQNFNSEYIFLDEVHYVKDWQGVLKRYIDLRRTKFIISGSESLEIQKARESLAGRLVTLKLNTLGFREYLGLIGRNITIRNIGIFDPKDMERHYNELITDIEYMEEAFNDYLFKGAFPEIALEDDPLVINKYVRDMVIRKIIFRDIPSIFDIRRRELLFDLMKFVCEKTSSLYNLNNLCHLFNANYETVVNYLSYLKSAFLIRTAEVYSPSPAKRARRNKKLYVVHPSLAFSVLGYDKNMLRSPLLGPYVESLFAGDTFYRDKHKVEVDTLIRNDELIPVEVKYQNTINNSDLKGIMKFKDRYGAGMPIVITRSTFEMRRFRDTDFLLIPAWLALLKWKQ